MDLNGLVEIIEEVVTKLDEADPGSEERERLLNELMDLCQLYDETQDHVQGREIKYREIALSEKKERDDMKTKIVTTLIASGVVIGGIVLTAKYEKVQVLAKTGLNFVMRAIPKIG